MSFSTLLPDDRSADSRGNFPCGNTIEDAETKVIKLPDDMSCEKCTVQLVWTTPVGTYYHCADLTLKSDDLLPCLNKCQHDGACVNGHCLCHDQFSGKYCEVFGISSTSTFISCGKRRQKLLVAAVASGGVAGTLGHCLYMVLVGKGKE